MTSCPSLLDTLGFLKFPDSTLINFSEDGTSDILKSLKSRSEESVPVVIEKSVTDDLIDLNDMTNVSDSKSNVTNDLIDLNDMTNVSASKSNGTNVSDSDKSDTFSKSEETTDTKMTSQSGSGTDSFYRSKRSRLKTSRKKKKN